MFAKNVRLEYYFNIAHIYLIFILLKSSYKNWDRLNWETKMSSVKQL